MAADFKFERETATVRRMISRTDLKAVFLLIFTDFQQTFSFILNLNSLKECDLKAILEHLK